MIGICYCLLFVMQELLFHINAGVIRRTLSEVTWTVSVASLPSGGAHFWEIERFQDLYLAVLGLYKPCRGLETIDLCVFIALTNDKYTINKFRKLGSWYIHWKESQPRPTSLLPGYASHGDCPFLANWDIVRAAAHWIATYRAHWKFPW